jgi:hypothetical protein
VSEVENEAAALAKVKAPKPPKTPSAGQLRAVARALGNATIPSTDELLLEARDVVGEWLVYQADLKGPRS